MRIGGQGPLNQSLQNSSGRDALSTASFKNAQNAASSRAPREQKSSSRPNESAREKPAAQHHEHSRGEPTSMSHTHVHHRGEGGDSDDERGQNRGEPMEGGRHAVVRGDFKVVTGGDGTVISRKLMASEASSPESALGGSGNAGRAERQTTAPFQTAQDEWRSAFMLRGLEPGEARRAAAMATELDARHPKFANSGVALNNVAAGVTLFMENGDSLDQAFARMDGLLGSVGARSQASEAGGALADAMSRISELTRRGVSSERAVAIAEEPRFRTMSGNQFSVAYTSSGDEPRSRDADEWRSAFMLRGLEPGEARRAAAMATELDARHPKFAGSGVALNNVAAGVTLFMRNGDSLDQAFARMDGLLGSVGARSQASEAEGTLADAVTDIEADLGRGATPEAATGRVIDRLLFPDI